MLIDEGLSGGSVAIAVGEVLTIQLKENATTGYRWSVESAGGLQWEEGSQGGASAGSGGVHEFRFHAVQPGSHDVCLKHWRDWEGERGVISRFPITVRVG